MNDFVVFIFLRADYKHLSVPRCPVSVNLSTENLP